MLKQVYETVSGQRIVFRATTPTLEKFIQRLVAMVDDPDVSEAEMLALVYSAKENPVLAQDVFPERGAVTKKVLKDPVYAVMTDLLFRKGVSSGAIDVDRYAAQYTLTVTQAAERIGAHDSAIRQAIQGRRLSAWVHNGLYYLAPAKLDAFAASSTRLKKPRNGQ